jgi:hypothetical protein
MVATQISTPEYEYYISSMQVVLYCSGNSTTIHTSVQIMYCTSSYYSSNRVLYSSTLEYSEYVLEYLARYSTSSYYEYSSSWYYYSRTQVLRVRKYEVLNRWRTSSSLVSHSRSARKMTAIGHNINNAQVESNRSEPHTVICSK